MRMRVVIDVTAPGTADPETVRRVLEYAVADLEERDFPVGISGEVVRWIEQGEELLLSRRVGNDDGADEQWRAESVDG